MPPLLRSAARYVDLLTLILLVLLLLYAVYVFDAPPAVRALLGVPFVFLAPGYGIVSAAFPSRRDLDLIERLGLGLALSVAILTLCAVIVNYGWAGVRFDPLLALESGVALSTLMLALGRRLSEPWDEAFYPVELAVAADAGKPDFVPFLACGVLATALVIVLVVTARDIRSQRDPSTAFYVLGSQMQAEGYQRQVRAGEPLSLVVGVTNREGQDETYQVKALLSGAALGGTGPLPIDDGETKEWRLDLQPAQAGESQALDLLLYIDGQRDPYRQLRVFISVTGAAPANPTGR